MRKFVIKTFQIIIPLLATIVILEVLTRNLPDDSYRIVKNYIEDNKDSIEMIILGTSHNTSGVNPNFINIMSANLANGSQPLEYDYFFIEKYAKELSNLKYVILEYSYHSLWYNPISTKSWRAYYYHKYFNCNLNVKKYSIKKISDFLIHPDRNFARLYDYYFLNGADVTKKNDTKGWELMDGNFNGRNYEEVMVSGGKKYRDYWKNFFKEEHMDLNIKYLNSIFSLCKENQLKLIVVTPPVFESYSKYIRQDKYELMQRVIKDFKTKYQFEYYNYFYDDHFELEDFYNHNHLNGIGSTKYSLLINEILTNHSATTETYSADL